ncbi:STAS domain-containing protein [Sporosarcina sp. Te-1]|uniref:STAS domain-containing protein n=1 Tax=Sporosarcina sp. Te-1 TaxID=2818390 RepID=UPI001A9F5D6B|nr:STAS domain-containing protein [Sporosarcina sp. Te-1]QTD42945.1 STAS domain-containing protein [Sporosarcina sp. Te-1]
MPFLKTGLAIPIFAINTDLEILKSNDTAKSVLAGAQTILDVIEEESRPKAVMNLLRFETIKALEINALSSSGNILLADLYVAWSEENIGEVLIVEKDKAVQKVSEQLNSLRSRLNDTNFELLEAKETAEELLHENIKLSSPFIEVTDTIALIPIYGGLDKTKTELIASTLSRRAYLSEVETLILDFTAVGHIEQSGLQGLESLLKVLQLLGFSVVIAGLHPQHVQEWNDMNFTLDIRFMKSLKSAMENLLAVQQT